MTIRGKKNATEFLNKNVDPNGQINTDGGKGFIHVDHPGIDYRELDSNQEKINDWIPWVHKFISNAKAWIVGTHHGVEAKYLDLYLAEYTYRFNRRHDPDSLFHRALRACTLARPSRFGTLCG